MDQIDGHVIDCIDVNKQLAFRHPLLINHTLQMEPTYYPEEARVNDYVMEASHPWNLSRSCPEGSIPIEKAQINGVSSRFNPHYDLVHEFSLLWLSVDKSYGAKASINVWNPKVENKNEYSASQIWVQSKDDRTVLEAGWMVYPRMYGGNETRFFISWTSKAYDNGCYNLDCPGFVQTNRQSILNTYLRPLSVYGGPQYSIDVGIIKDMRTENWWVFLQGVPMGYWPKELVPSLAAEGTDNIQLGGDVAFSKERTVHTSAQMGSGHFPYEGFQKSSFIKNIKYLDASYAYRDPVEKDTMLLFKPNCYDLRVGEKKDGPWGYFFFYGGPGRSPQCMKS